MKLLSRYLPLVLAGAFLVPFASAQSTFDFNVGFGAVEDSAASGIDYTTNLLCSSGSSTTCIPPHSLSGFMLGIGGNLMLWKHFGVGAEVNLEPGKQTYYICPAACLALLNGQFGGGLSAYTEQSRTTFYDFNGIFVPVKTKKGIRSAFGRHRRNEFQNLRELYSRGNRDFVQPEFQPIFRQIPEQFSGAWRRGRPDLFDRPCLPSSAVRCALRARSHPIRSKYADHGEGLAGVQLRRAVGAARGLRRLRNKASYGKLLRRRPGGRSGLRQAPADPRSSTLIGGL